MVISLPKDPSLGQEIVGLNGRTLKWNGRYYESKVSFTTPGSSQVVNNLIDDKLANLGNMAYRDAFISTQDPDDSLGKDGDLWIKHS